jgi:hypothetical protein
VVSSRLDHSASARSPCLRVRDGRRDPFDLGNSRQELIDDSADEARAPCISEGPAVGPMRCRARNVGLPLDRQGTDAELALRRARLSRRQLSQNDNRAYPPLSLEYA